MKWLLLALSAIAFFVILAFRAQKLEPEARLRLRPMAAIVASCVSFLTVGVSVTIAWHAGDLWTAGFYTSVGIIGGLLAHHVQHSLITAILGREDSETIFERGRKILDHKAASRTLEALKVASPEPATPSSAKKGKAAPNASRDPVPPAKAPAREPPLIYWGHCSLPESEALRHFCVIGTTGSGKTITIRLLMRSVLPRIRPGSDWRALIFDAKRDTMSRIAAMPIHVPIRILNPFDKRSAPWDMATDIASPAAAQYLAKLLIPEEVNASQPFFADAARHILYGTLVALNELHPQEWIFRDVLLALRVPERIKALLEKTATTAEIASQYFAETRTVSSIVSTLATKLQRYEIIAALWATSRTPRFSLEAWLSEESILVLGKHPSYKSSIEPINEAIFQRLVDLILSLPDSDRRRTYFFLDEVREAGKLDGLWSLLNQGRSKGACVVIGFQDIEGLRSAYGEKVAHEIVGQCNNKTFLRTDSPPTAEWVERHFGQVQQRERAPGNPAVAKAQANINVPHQRVVRSAILASEIMSIPKTGPEHGLTAIHDIPLVGFAYTTNVPFSQLLEIHAFDQDKTTPDEESRPKTEERLAPWTDADHRRILGEEPRKEAPADVPPPATPPPKPLEPKSRPKPKPKPKPKPASPNPRPRPKPKTRQASLNDIRRELNDDDTD